jgi:hypothetical protein
MSVQHGGFCAIVNNNRSDFLRLTHKVLRRHSTAHWTTLLWAGFIAPVAFGLERGFE